MSTPRTGWAAWLLAGLGGAATICAVLLLFRSPVPPPSALKPAIAAPSKAGPVGLVPWAEGAADQLLKDEAMLRDPTPLFLPTQWNAAENVLPSELRREPGSAFEGYPPKTSFEETELAMNFPPIVLVPARPADGFSADKPARPFGGIGQTDFSVGPLAARGGFVEVVGAGDGRLILAEPLSQARPPGEGGWQPLEFLIAVDASGLVRPPVLTESSRVAAVDGYFQEYLGSGLHIGERLPPGFYRICIGP